MTGPRRKRAKRVYVLPDGLRAWMQSPAGRANAARFVKLAAEKRAAAPKCGARRRTEGGAPCRNVALENGRCRYHGGRTPKGADWHKPQLPTSGSLAKADRKSDDLEKRRKKRERRVAAMSTEERQRYERHIAARKPGPASERVRRRRNIAERERIAAALAEPRAETPETLRLAEQIAALERESVALTAACGKIPAPLGDNAERPPQRQDAGEEGNEDMANDEDTPGEALARNLERLRTEGLDAATDAAIDLLRDGKAPAQARSAAINAVFRAAGLFRDQESDEGERDLSQMSAAELDAMSARLARELADLKAKAAKPESDEDGPDGGEGDPFA